MSDTLRRVFCSLIVFCHLLVTTYFLTSFFSLLINFLHIDLIRNDTFEYGVSPFHYTSNNEIGAIGSLKVALFDRPYTIYYWSAAVSIALSCTIFALFDLE